MKIFAVETSAKSASVAITDNSAIMGEFFINTMLTHSETLMPMADALFKNVRLAPADIDCFAVNVGPGSFTGLRIGVAAVKGMAYALGKPCAAVSTLESMAHNISSFAADSVICAVMDARCSQVYNALFTAAEGNVSTDVSCGVSTCAVGDTSCSSHSQDATDEHKNAKHTTTVSGTSLVRLCDDRALSVEELTQELVAMHRRVILIGDGAKLCYEHMRGRVNVTVAPENVLYQRASSVAFAAECIASVGGCVSAAQLMPTYLRLPQAERERLARKK